MIFFAISLIMWGLLVLRVSGHLNMPRLKRSPQKNQLNSKAKFSTKTGKVLYDKYMALPVEKRPAGDIVRAIKGLEVKYSDVGDGIDNHFDGNSDYRSLGYKFEHNYYCPVIYYRDSKGHSCDFNDVYQLLNSMESTEAEVAREKRIIERQANVSNEDEASAMIEAFRNEAKLAREANDHFEELTKG